MNIPHLLPRSMPGDIVTTLLSINFSSLYFLSNGIYDALYMRQGGKVR